MLNSKFALAGNYVGKKWQIFKCPEDNYLSPLQKKKNINFRIRSVSMNSFMGPIANWSLAIPNQDETRMRMANAHRYGGLVYDRLSEIRQPSKRWLFIDAHPCSINFPGFDIEGVRYNGSFDPTFQEFPSSEHDGGATLGFVVRHVELKKWKNNATNIKIIHHPMEFWDFKEELQESHSVYKDWKWIVSRMYQLKFKLP